MDARASRSCRAIACALVALAAISGGCAPRESKVSWIAAPEAQGAISRDPSVALEPMTDDVLLTWLAGDSTSLRVWFAHSTDRGHTWATPVAVSPPGEPLEPQGEAAPRIACDAHGHIAIIWATGSEDVNGERPASELRLVRSLDRGKSWSAPVTLHEGLNDVPRTHRFHDLASTDEGRLVAAWLVNPTPGDTSHFLSGEGGLIHVAVSSDFGGHWGQASPEWSHVCPCCRVAVGTDLVGGTFAAFRRHDEDGSCDVALARPSGPPVSAYHDGWKSEACPRSGPGFEVARDGTLRLAWYTGATDRTGLWFRQSAPESYDTTAVPLLLMRTKEDHILHVTVGDAGMSGTLIVCDGDSASAGPLTLFRVEPSGRRMVERLAVEGQRDGIRPQLAASNRSRRAYVAWTERDGAARRLRLLRWDVGR